MEYNQFVEVFNKRLFKDIYKKLLESLAKNPESFTGIFRLSKPINKMAQNISQSREIKFGYALEDVIEQYLIDNNFSLKNQNLTSNGESLRVDQYFEKDNHVYFVEQKVRDNHDSTKKTGQMDNFLKKESVIINENTEKICKGYFYFIDPSFKKNRNYYLNRIENESSIGLVCYGSEFFDDIGMSSVWTEIVEYLNRWREDVPGITNLNFDSEDDAFNQAIELKPLVWKKLFANSKIIEEILPIIFPDGTLLNNIYRERMNDSSWNAVCQTIKDYLIENNQFSHGS